MQRNILRHLPGPRRALPLQTRPYHREEPNPTPPSELTTDQATHILHVADQSALRSTTVAATKFLTRLRALQTHTSEIPYTLTHPSIPLPYTLSSLREKITTTTPALANETIAAVSKAQTHLHDLATAGYAEAKSGADATLEFEKEVSGWNEEKKRRVLREWRLEEEARLVRLNELSLRLVRFVEEVLRKGSQPRGRRDVVGAGEEEALGFKEVTMTEEERRMAKAGDERVEKPGANVGGKGQSLADLQKQLEANVQQTAGRS